MQDLVLYRKFKNKEVSGAARALLALFRQLNPSMLAKKDRGKGADLDAKPRAFGDVPVSDRIEVPPSRPPYVTSPPLINASLPVALQEDSNSGTADESMPKHSCSVCVQCRWTCPPSALVLLSGTTGAENSWCQVDVSIASNGCWIPGYCLQATFLNTTASHIRCQQ